MKQFLILLAIGLSVAFAGFMMMGHNDCTDCCRTQLADNDSGAVIACTLAGPELIARKLELQNTLRPLIIRQNEIKNGFAFTFPLNAEMQTILKEFVRIESGCCGFLEYALTSHEEANIMLLQITGPEAAQEFIRDNFVDSIGSE